MNFVKLLEPSEIRCHSQDDWIGAETHLRVFRADLPCAEDIARVSP